MAAPRFCLIDFIIAQMSEKSYGFFMGSQKFFERKLQVQVAELNLLAALLFLS